MATLPRRRARPRRPARLSLNRVAAERAQASRIMFRLLAPILIVAVSGFGSPPAHYDQQHCVDAPAQEVAAYTASLGGGAEVLTSCDAVAADGAACADPEAKIGCCASCSEKQEALR